MTTLVEVKHFENNYNYFQIRIVYMTAVKVIPRKRFNTRKINAWFKKNEEKLAKLALAGLLSVPVLILLVKYLKEGTLNTREKNTIANTIEKVDNLPLYDRIQLVRVIPEPRIEIPSSKTPPITRVKKTVPPLPDREALKKTANQTKQALGKNYARKYSVPGRIDTNLLDSMKNIGIPENSQRTLFRSNSSPTKATFVELLGSFSPTKKISPKAEFPEITSPVFGKSGYFDDTLRNKLLTKSRIRPEDIARIKELDEIRAKVELQKKNQKVTVKSPKALRDKARSTPEDVPAPDYKLGFKRQSVEIMMSPDSGIKPYISQTDIESLGNQVITEPKNSMKNMDKNGDKKPTIIQYDETDYSNAFVAEQIRKITRFNNQSKK